MQSIFKGFGITVERVVITELKNSTYFARLILQQQITTGLLQSKIDAATAEIDSARVTVENSLSGADSVAVIAGLLPQAPTARSLRERMEQWQLLVKFPARAVPPA